MAGGGRQFFLQNSLVVLYLGCIPNFNVLLCLELAKKFVVWWCGGGGGVVGDLSLL